MIVGLLNVHSVSNKAIAISDTITTRSLDLLILTETWHHASEDLALRRCAPLGYSIIDVTRQESTGSDSETRGGGIAIIHRNCYTGKRIAFDIRSTTFEVLGCSIRSSSAAIVYIIIYRPGSVAVSELFFDELTELLEIVAPFRNQIILAGDFNIHVNDPSDRHAIRLAEILECFDLQQSVSNPTHCGGNTLDLVITRPDSKPTSCIVDPPMISDHSLIVCRFPSASITTRQISTTSRQWKKIDRMAFMHELASVFPSDINELRKKSANELFELYNSTLRQLADKFAPLRTKSRRIKHLSPWFDDDCFRSRRLSRRLERHYRRSKNSKDQAAWITQVHSMHKLYQEKENFYWTSRIATSAGNSRKTWDSFLAILKKDKDPSAPQPSLGANKLSQFFIDKTEAVRAATQGSDFPNFPACPGSFQFNHFREYSLDEVRRVLLNSPVKTCSLDPIPTDLLLESINIVLPVIWAMCNASLKEGHLPSSQKEAIVTPIIKKQGLDADDTTSYRPISNLSFISKVIERIVSEQIRTYLTTSNLMPSLQSAYRPGHSTETAVLKVLSDIIDAADGGNVTLLGLLDMSAAFDTVDFQILLKRLETSYGVGGTALNWFASFLSGRNQVVAFGGQHSVVTQLSCGVPQGSVLGPLLFVLYVADVMEIAQSHGISIHAYADDMQIYISCEAAEQESAKAKLLCCIEGISNWMSSNRLKLNANKTEFMWLGTRQQLAKTNSHSVEVDGRDVALVLSARDLGVTLDNKLTMDIYAKNIARNCFYQLRQLRSIQRSLTPEARHVLVTAFIHSRLDYCNAVFYGVAKQTIHKLQTCLNAAARLVTGVRKYDRITPTIRDVLHWLPVEQRITYKIAALAFDCVRGTCPDYFRGICSPLSGISGRSGLRAAHRGDVYEPATKTKTIGPRSFRVAAPVVWNSLPSHLRLSTISRKQFRAGLKTYLFKIAYA